MVERPKTVYNTQSKGTPSKVKLIRNPSPRVVDHPGFDFRNSFRWFSTETSERRLYSIPFVSKVGKLTIHRLYEWKAYPEQVIAGLASTVCKKLQRVLGKRHTFRVAKKYNHHLMVVSICYALSHDDWILDRLLGMTRKRKCLGAIPGFMRFLVSNLDEAFRFAFGQIVHSISWLKHEVFRPRDKSSTKYDLGGFHPHWLDGCLKINDFISPDFHPFACNWLESRKSFQLSIKRSRQEEDCGKQPSEWSEDLDQVDRNLLAEYMPGL